MVRVDRASVADVHRWRRRSTRRQRTGATGHPSRRARRRGRQGRSRLRRRGQGSSSRSPISSGCRPSWPQSAASSRSGPDPGEPRSGASSYAEPVGQPPPPSFPPRLRTSRPGHKNAASRAASSSALRSSANRGSSTWKAPPYAARSRDSSNPPATKHRTRRSDSPKCSPRPSTAGYMTPAVTTPASCGSWHSTARRNRWGDRTTSQARRATTATLSLSPRRAWRGIWLKSVCRIGGLDVMSAHSVASKVQDRQRWR